MSFLRYSISEAAFYVRISVAALCAWTLVQNYTNCGGVHRTFKPLIRPTLAFLEDSLPLAGHAPNGGLRRRRRRLGRSDGSGQQRAMA